MSKVPDLVKRAMELGMPALALTDHGCMYGIKEFVDIVKKSNKGADKPLKPIIGIETYCARRSRLLKDNQVKELNGEGKEIIIDRGGWHLILLAKNKVGYKNLCKLSSIAFIVLLILIILSSFNFAVPYSLGSVAPSCALVFRLCNSTRFLSLPTLS